MLKGKRVRGWLLRLVLKRAVAVVIGIALLTPALWIFVGNPSWANQETNGIGVVLGATGAAFILAGLGGRRPDWIDPDDRGSEDA